MVKRQVVSTDLSTTRTRHRTVLSTDLCAEIGEESMALKYWLLDLIAQTPDLTACGPLPFGKMTFYHDGQSWVAELEAIEDSTEG